MNISAIAFNPTHAHPLFINPFRSLVASFSPTMEKSWEAGLVSYKTPHLWNQACPAIERCLLFSYLPPHSTDTDTFQYKPSEGFHLLQLHSICLLSVPVCTWIKVSVPHNCVCTLMLFYLANPAPTQCFRERVELVCVCVCVRACARTGSIQEVLLTCSCSWVMEYNFAQSKDFGWSNSFVGLDPVLRSQL